MGTMTVVSESQVTVADVDRFQRDGAVVLRGVLDPDQLALLTRGIEEAHDAPGQPSSRLAAAETGETVVHDYACEISPSLATFLAEGSVGRIAAELMRRDSAQLILDQIFYKDRGAIVPTPWHQDTAFLRVRGDALVRLWFPCDFSPRELTVQVLRGSHRWNVVYSAGGSGVGDSALPMTPDVARHRDSFDVLSWDVAPGDVLAFQGNMVHGSDGRATIGAPRRAFAVLLGGPDLAFHQPSGVAFPSPGRRRGLRARDDIPDGAPISEYEDAFPVCWQRA
jgi:ectoine hydroxylase-related dioxygenase (phytanoyl-CoA dioxygenase family)